MNKNSLPSIDNDITPAPKKIHDLRNLKSPQSIDDENIDKNSKKIGKKWGAQTLLNSNETQLTSLRMVIPSYVDQQLSLKSADERVTKQYLVLKALSEQGYLVHDVDLVKDKRKQRKK